MDLPNTFEIPRDAAPDRADRLLAGLLPGVAGRSSLARLMRQGLVCRLGKPLRPSTILLPGDVVDFLTIPPQTEQTPARFPAIKVLFEDDHVVVVDKPPGLVVHPGAGTHAVTLTDFLVKDRPGMVGVGEPPRWGIVHRLDKDTSGVMLAAKTAAAHEKLSRLFRDHSVHRVYLALVRGSPGADSGIVDTAIGRHAKDRKRISVSAPKTREAVTRWRVKERFHGLTLLEVEPRTGRTHQIRVHLASVGLPVAGDPVYGKLRRSSAGLPSGARAAIATLNRQALHAAVLGFVHPDTGEYIEFSSELPEDIAGILSVLTPGEPA